MSPTRKLRLGFTACIVLAAPFVIFGFTHAEYAEGRLLVALGLFAVALAIMGLIITNRKARP